MTNMKKIECIIMDWAGTAVDYGCFAPVAAFVESFKAIGAPVTAAETLRKCAHFSPSTMLRLTSTQNTDAT